MINVGDLVEWTTNPFPLCERTDINPVVSYEFAIGVVFKEKIESLDGINKTKLFEVYFPNRQQYWIATDCLNKIA
jgi:hypothetical protein|tara:strand:- start:758 stop:982 length:225 start_codon:yes stop_codon:yes gene_type:complete